MLKKLPAFLVTFILLFQLGAFAQQLPFSGKVSNTKNEILAGATVLVIETAKQTTTDAEGRFVVNLEKGKKYTLTVSNTGYANKTIADIEVVDNLDNNSIEIILQDNAKTNLTGVTVVATSRRQENTNALLNFQKNNTALSSGLAADFIRRTPDKNTGEVLRRVSGTSIQDNKFVIVRGLSDRYNAAFINGAALPSSEPDKKAFSFDVIPSSLIDNIVINKTATPDITGEFAGGLVQIQTKDIPTSNQLSFGISLGFNTQSVFNNFVSNERGNTDWLGFSNNRSKPTGYPEKYGAYNKLALTEKVTISQSLDDKAYQEVASTAGPIQQYTLTWANVKKFDNGSAFGSIVGLTYRKSKMLYTASKVLFETDRSRNIFDYEDQQNKYSVNAGVIANVAWTYKKNKIAFKNLFNQLLEDNSYRRTGSVEETSDLILRSSVLNQRSLYSTQLEGNHELPFKQIKFNWNLNFAYNNKTQPDLRVQSYTRPITSPNDSFAINLRGNNTNRFFSDLEDKAYGYVANFTMPFEMGSHKQSLKIGGSGLVRLRDFKASIFGLSEPADAALRTLPYNEIFRSENIREGGFILTSDLQNPSDKYYGVSALSAAYVMLDNKLSEKLRLVWGARFEYFEQFLKSNEQGTEKAQVINTDKFDFLPSVNFTISPNKKTNIRFAASRTVARPEFREIASFAFFDFEQIASTSGNDTLKRSAIINGDIRYEFYPKAGELLSFGVFYKNFTDAIELRLNSASVGLRRQYDFQNAEEAVLYGFEAEFRKSLAFISPAKSWLSKLYFNGNVSYIFSEVTLGNVDASNNKLPATNRPLQGQSPYLINAGFQYDGEKGTNISLLYNRIGQRLALVGNETFPDIYEVPRDLIDFQISQKVMKQKGELRLTIGDILNQQVASYVNLDSKSNFKKGTDDFFSSYKPGTTITIGFNYNLDLKK